MKKKNFIKSFKQTSYYHKLFNVNTDIICIYIGGSRNHGTATSHSDYDLNVLVLDGEYLDEHDKKYVKYCKKTVHWYYVPINYIFSITCQDLCLFTGNLCLNNLLNSDNIIYINPKYEKIITYFNKIKRDLSIVIGYTIFNDMQDYILNLIDQESNDNYNYDKSLYLLNLTSYYLIEGALDKTYLRTLKTQICINQLNRDIKHKAIARLKLYEQYVKTNHINTQELYQKLKNECTIILQEVQSHVFK